MRRGSKKTSFLTGFLVLNFFFEIKWLQSDNEKIRHFEELFIYQNSKLHLKPCKSYCPYNRPNLLIFFLCICLIYKKGQFSRSLLYLILYFCMEKDALNRFIPSNLTFKVIFKVKLRFFSFFDLEILCLTLRITLNLKSSGTKMITISHIILSDRIK